MHRCRAFSIASNDRGIGDLTAETPVVYRGLSHGLPTDELSRAILHSSKQRFTQPLDMSKERTFKVDLLENMLLVPPGA